MKAWIFHENVDENGNHSGSTTLEERPIPSCGDGEVLIKVDCACVCGGDVDSMAHGGGNHKVLDGRDWGHELCGTIVEVGKDVEGLEKGMRVWPFPNFSTKQIGARAGALGGFSEYVIIDNPVKDYSLFVLDEKVSDIEGALIEPLAVGWHAGDVAAPGPGKNAVVFGSGCIGIGAALACAWKGCDKVAVVGRRPFKLGVSAELGFKTFSILDPDWKQQLEDYFGKGASFSGKAINAQCYVEATADDDIFDTIIPMMNRRSKLSVVAVHEREIKFNSNIMVFGSLCIEGSAAQRKQDVQEVIEMIRSKRFPVEKIANNLIRQDQLLDGIEKMRQAQATKSCIDYTGKYVK